MLSATRTEVPPPPDREPPRRSRPREAIVGVSPASNWVAGMQTEIREFAQSRRCTTPLVRMTLDDGEEFFLQAMNTGPGDDYVNLAIYPLKDASPRPVIVRLDAIKKVELLEHPPSKTEMEFVFHPRMAGVGFASGE
jgi:hypothetical protein